MSINIVWLQNYWNIAVRTVVHCMDNAIIETLILLVVFVIFLSYVIYRRCCKDIKYNSRVDTTENISTDTTNQQQQQQQQQQHLQSKYIHGDHTSSLNTGAIIEKIVDV